MQMTNPALDELLGYPPDGLVGKPALDCIKPGDRAAVAAARSRQCEDGKDYSVTARLLCSDGR